MEEPKKIEVWSQDNYDFVKGSSNALYFHKSFEDENEALNYIHSRLDAQIEELKKNDAKATNEELLHRYKMYGTDYLLKYASKGFSSWIYVEKMLNS